MSDIRGNFIYLPKLEKLINLSTVTQIAFKKQGYGHKESIIVIYFVNPILEYSPKKNEDMILDKDYLVVSNPVVRNLITEYFRSQLSYPKLRDSFPQNKF